MFKLFKEESGQSMVLATLTIVVLLGFTALVIDVGKLYAVKQELRTAADAAALAGAQDLIKAPSSAASTAEHYAITLNGAEKAKSTTPYKGDSKKIEVVCKTKVQAMFSRFLGSESITVSARAVAGFTPADGVKGLVPIGLEQQTFEPGVSYTLKEGGGDGSNGNYGGLDFKTLNSFTNSSFKNGGAQIFQNLLTYGYDQPVYVGEKVDTQPGAMSGKSELAINRIVLIPIVDSMDVNGKKTVTIVGFAAFKITSSNLKKGVITGVFQKMVTGDSVSGDIAQADLGLYHVRLVE